MDLIKDNCMVVFNLLNKNMKLLYEIQENKNIAI